MVGKIGNSKAFMKRLIDRSAAIQNIFPREVACRSKKQSQSNDKQIKTGKLCLRHSVLNIPDQRA